jgi:hypothetical protein
MSNAIISAPQTSTAPAPSRPDVLEQLTQSHWPWVTSVFLAGLGAKCWLLFHFGTALPYWDAWDVEAQHLYLPYYEGHLSLAELFRAHNEHRMFFPRLYCLALLLLNGQWDNGLQTAANAIIHSGTLAVLGWRLACLMGKKAWPIIWLLLALALAAPFAWENTFGGGLYTQFYFLLLLSLTMIWLMRLRRPLSPAWWLGAVAGAAALFTAGSGFLAAAAVLVLTALETLKQPRRWRQQLPTVAICGMLGLAAFFLNVDVPRHHAFHAHSLGQFLGALGRNLAWPYVDEPWCALVNPYPLVLLGWMYLRSRENQQPAEQIILGMGLWVVLQAAAAGYARGAEFSIGSEGSPPASRYMDSCSFLMIANGLSIALLATRYRERLWRPPVCFAGFAVWAVVCMAGLWALTESVSDDIIPLWTKNRDSRIQTISAFVATDDPQVLLDAPTGFRLSPDLDQLMRLLRNPGIRSILPACVREPMRVTPKAKGDTTFVANGCNLAEADPPWERCWGSYSGSGATARGKFESLPVTKSGLPILEIPVAGDLGAAGLSLELVDLVSGQVTRVKPEQAAEEGWRNAFVKAPAHEFKLVASDESETGWFAFKEPREVGRLSYWAMRLVGAWKSLVLVGVACLLAAGARVIRGLVGQRQPTVSL